MRLQPGLRAVEEAHEQVGEQDILCRFRRATEFILSVGEQVAHRIKGAAEQLHQPNLFSGLGVRSGKRAGSGGEGVLHERDADQVPTPVPGLAAHPRYDGPQSRGCPGLEAPPLTLSRTRFERGVEFSVQLPRAARLPDFCFITVGEADARWPHTLIAVTARVR